MKVTFTPASGESLEHADLDEMVKSLRDHLKALGVGSHVQQQPDDTLSPWPALRERVLAVKAAVDDQAKRMLADIKRLCKEVD